MNYEELAKQILEAVGGEENVSSVGNCMTRLRFILKDNDKVNAEAIHKIKAVKGVSKAAGQYQIIVGSELTTDLCNAVNALGTFTPMSDDIKKKVNIGDVVIGFLSGSMYPLVGVLVGCAMINIIASVASLLGADTSVGTWAFFTAIAGIAGYFLPVFAGYSAAKYLGATPMYGMFVGMAMLYPSLSGLIAAEGGLKLFGITLLNYGYSNTVIPALLACIVLKYVEKFARKICPKLIAIFAVPALVFIIMAPVIYLIIGPIGTFIGNLMTQLVTLLMEHAGFLAIGLLAAVLPFVVMAGIHMGMFPIYYAAVAAFGADVIFFPAFMAYNLSTAGVALAVALRTKNSELRSLGVSSSISAMCGITEPSLFGICLRFKNMLIALMGGSAIGGIVSYFVNYRVSAPVAQSIFSIPLAVGSGVENVVSCIIVFVVSFLASFVLAWFLSGKDIRTVKPAVSEKN